MLGRNRRETNRFQSSSCLIAPYAPEIETRGSGVPTPAAVAFYQGSKSPSFIDFIFSTDAFQLPFPLGAAAGGWAVNECWDLKSEIGASVGDAPNLCLTRDHF